MRLRGGWAATYCTQPSTMSMFWWPTVGARSNTHPIQLDRALQTTLDKSFLVSTGAYALIRAEFLGMEFASQIIDVLMLMLMQAMLHLVDGFKIQVALMKHQIT